MNHKSIVLVDDDDDDCSLFEEAMFEVDSSAALMTANSCSQLLGQLSDVNAEIPDLIVMDFNMPKQNGFECLAILKENNNLKDVPVIIFSTAAQRETVDLVYKYGAAYYITKPDAFNALKRIVSRILSIDLNNVKPQAREKFLLEF